MRLFLENLFLKNLNMKKFNIIIWSIWLLLVVIWNYGYPEATSFQDVLATVILSALNLIVLKFIKK